MFILIILCPIFAIFTYAILNFVYGFDIILYINNCIADFVNRSTPSTTRASSVRCIPVEASLGVRRGVHPLSGVAKADVLAGESGPLQLVEGVSDGSRRELRPFDEFTLRQRRFLL